MGKNALIDWSLMPALCFVVGMMFFVVIAILNLNPKWENILNKIILILAIFSCFSIVIAIMTYIQQWI